MRQPSNTASDTISALSSVGARMAICFLLASILMSGASLFAEPGLDQDEHRAALEARLKMLTNYWADYEVTTLYDPPSRVPPQRTANGRGLMIQRNSAVTEARRTERLHDLVRYELKTVHFEDELEGTYLTRAEIEVRGEERSEHLFTQGENLDRHTGRIEADRPLPRDTLGVMLGLRLYDEQGWIDLDQAHAEAQLREREGLVELEIAAERGRMHTWTFNPAENYRLEQYRLWHAPTNWIMLEMTGEDFIEINGLVLPRRIREHSYGKDPEGNAVSRRARDLTIKQYVVNPPENRPERYRIEWPDGARVHDHRTGTVLISRDGQLFPLGTNPTPFP